MFFGGILLGTFLSPFVRRALPVRAVFVLELWTWVGCAAFLVWPNVYVLAVCMLPTALVIPSTDSVVHGYRIAMTPDRLLGRAESAWTTFAIVICAVRPARSRECSSPRCRPEPRSPVRRRCARSCRVGNAEPVDPYRTEPRQARRGALFLTGACGQRSRVAGYGATVLQHLLSSILADKSGDVLKIDGDATVFEAITLMVEANVGSLLVTDDDEIIGIMTERDYLRRVTLQGRTDKETPVRDIMSSPLYVVTVDTPIDECMALMTDRRIRHVPVVDEGEVVGVISIGDLVKYTSKQQAFEIKYLTDYITGRR